MIPSKDELLMILDKISEINKSVGETQVTVGFLQTQLEQMREEGDDQHKEIFKEISGIKTDVAVMKSHVTVLETKGNTKNTKNTKNTSVFTPGFIKKLVLWGAGIGGGVGAVVKFFTGGGS